MDNNCNYHFDIFNKSGKKNFVEKERQPTTSSFAQAGLTC
jgi:hypothetical protein